MYDDDDGFGAVDAGLMYGLYRHGQDRQTEAIINALRPADPLVVGDEPDEPMLPELRPAPNALENVKANLPQSWDDFIGQEPLKRDLMVRIAASKRRGDRLPHVLLESGYPGVGKTTVARLLAGAMGVQIVELVPPFNILSLVMKVQEMNDKDIVFIDEIHKLADGGKRGAEILLKILEDGVAYLPDGRVSDLPDVTYVGATTDADKLPGTIIDRFKVHPYFQAYSRVELARISVKYSSELVGDEEWLTDDLVLTIADACRSTPRVIESMVDSVRDMDDALGSVPTGQELLAFIEVEPDGLTRTHAHYLTAMRQYFARATKDGDFEYIVGEAAIKQMLRLTQQGVAVVEAFLVERGFINRTPRGRQLTDRGIARAEDLIAAGKGAANVA